MPQASRTSKRSSNRAILLSCYMSGATEGRNLGTAGYSYDFVAKLFARCFERRAQVILVNEPEHQLDKAAENARQQGLDPIHVSFLPFQDVHFCSTTPNIVVPAWEFPDVPNQAFDGDPRNDWVAMANRCELVIVGGPFTVDALRRGGTTSPIRVVPVPTPEAYFAVDDWQADQRSHLECRVYWPTTTTQVQATTQNERRYLLRQSKEAFTQSLGALQKAAIGLERYHKISGYFRARRIERRRRKTQRQITEARRSAPERIELDHPFTDTLDTSGVVYSSVFNPDDGRKNWQDLLNGFLYALADKPDATLILKLITRRAEAARQVINYYINRDVPHTCRVGFIVDFLSDEKMVQLASASTYYLQTTKAEGNCLPLMNYMASGRPGVSPNHSAMSDYFDHNVGFVVDSHPEPAAWPHDSQLRLRTTWGRIVWPSVQQQVRRSYEVATSDIKAYHALALEGRQRMQNWASFETVERRINALLDEYDEHGTFCPTPSERTAIELRRAA